MKKEYFEAQLKKTKPVTKEDIEKSSSDWRTFDFTKDTIREGDKVCWFWLYCKDDHVCRLQMIFDRNIDKIKYEYSDSPSDFPRFNE